MTESSTWPSSRDPQGPMKKSISLLAKQKIQSGDADGLPESTKRFADGSRWKIEIPSVEGPDDFGSPVRHYEVPDLVRVAAPIYLKFTVRNSPGLYPSETHIQGVVESTARERVRRAAIGYSMLTRYGFEK